MKNQSRQPALVYPPASALRSEAAFRNWWDGLEGYQQTDWWHHWGANPYKVSQHWKDVQRMAGELGAVAEDEAVAYAKFLIEVLPETVGEMPAAVEPEPPRPRPAPHREQKHPSPGQVIHREGEPYAIWGDITKIRTDPKRFQNRTTAFSELSADAVANDFDPNKFDPVVVWVDPKDREEYMLAGHSRFEGMARRGEPLIPKRYFIGTEAEAIQYARVESNRAAAAENFVEDLKAYKLMRDGDKAKGLEPASKAELRRAFKGKVTKLSAYANLNPNGKFVIALAEDDRSNYPYIESRAQWTGELREEFPEITDIHERDIFDWLYSENGGIKLPKADFIKIVEERLLLGRDRLFPECGDGSCRQVDDVSELLRSKRERELYKELEEAEAAIRAIEERFRTSKPYNKVHTDPEREALRSLLESYTDDKKRLQKELGIAERAKDEPGLFGLGRATRYDRYPAHQREAYKRFDELLALRDGIRKRLRATNIADRVYTQPERDVLTRILGEGEDERLRISNQLNLVQRERQLFGSLANMKKYLVTGRGGWYVLTPDGWQNVKTGQLNKQLQVPGEKWRYDQKSVSEADVIEAETLEQAETKLAERLREIELRDERNRQAREEYNKTPEAQEKQRQKEAMEKAYQKLRKAFDEGGGIRGLIKRANKLVKGKIEAQSMSGSAYARTKDGTRYTVRDHEEIAPRSESDVTLMVTFGRDGSTIEFYGIGRWEPNAALSGEENLEAVALAFAGEIQKWANDPENAKRRIWSIPPKYADWTFVPKEEYHKIHARHKEF